MSKKQLNEQPIKHGEVTPFSYRFRSLFDYRNLLLFFTFFFRIWMLQTSFNYTLVTSNGLADQMNKNTSVKIRQKRLNLRRELLQRTGSPQRVWLSKWLKKIEKWFEKMPVPTSLVNRVGIFVFAFVFVCVLILLVRFVSLKIFFYTRKISSNFESDS